MPTPGPSIELLLWVRILFASCLVSLGENRNAGECTIDPDQLQLCITPDLFTALERVLMDSDQTRAERRRRDFAPACCSKTESMKLDSVDGSTGLAKQRTAPHSRMRASVSGE